jgi:phosphatidylglycerol:prolipoprotein diacylglycerol transferase
MFPTLFHIGSFELRGYAFLIALGGLLYFLLLKTREQRMGLARADMFWMLVNTVLASGFLGARAVSILFRLPMDGAALLRAALAVNSGFSVFGFIAGIAAGVYVFCRYFKLDFPRVADYIFAGLPLWQVFGRLGCFARGCCCGLPAGRGTPWAVAFRNAGAAVPPELLGVPLHPAQLYEAAGSALLLLALYLALRLAEKGRLAAGSVFAFYLIGYGFIRFVCERYRAGTSAFHGLPVTTGQFFALLLAAAGAALLFKIKKPRKVYNS